MSHIGKRYTLQLPRPGEPESALLPGMSAPAPRAAPEPFEAPTALSMPDTSIGPVALQEPATWSYDFDPATGSSRASYPGVTNIAGGGANITPAAFVNPSTAAPPAPGFLVSARYGTQTANDIFSKLLNVPPRGEFHALEGVLTVTNAVTSLNVYNAAVGGFCSLQTANGIGFAIGGYAVAEANNCQTGSIGTVQADSPNTSGIYTGVKLQIEHDWY